MSGGQDISTTPPDERRVKRGRGLKWGKSGYRVAGREERMLLAYFRVSW